MTLRNSTCAMKAFSVRIALLWSRFSSTRFSQRGQTRQSFGLRTEWTIKVQEAGDKSGLSGLVGWYTLRRIASQAVGCGGALNPVLESTTSEAKLGRFIGVT